MSDVLTDTEHECDDMYGYPINELSTHVIVGCGDEKNTCPHCGARGALHDIQFRHHYASHVCGTEFDSDQRTAQCYVIGHYKMLGDAWRNMLQAQHELTDKAERECERQRDRADEFGDLLAIWVPKIINHVRKEGAE